MGFFTVKTDEESVRDFSGSTKYINKSGMYELIIKNAIENLPIQYKIPITLREIQGLSYDEISAITKTSIGTVKSRISRARAKIKDDIDKYTRG